MEKIVEHYMFQVQLPILTVYSNVIYSFLPSTLREEKFVVESRTFFRNSKVALAFEFSM